MHDYKLRRSQKLSYAPQILLCELSLGGLPSPNALLAFVN
jgi:hypothetical protein